MKKSRLVLFVSGLLAVGIAGTTATAQEVTGTAGSPKPTDCAAAARMKFGAKW